MCKCIHVRVIAICAWVYTITASIACKKVGIVQCIRTKLCGNGGGSSAVYEVVGKVGRVVCEKEGGREEGEEGLWKD